MIPSAWFACIGGCPERHPLAAPLYRCPRCDALLEVQHDLDALRQRPPAAWRALFDARLRGPRWPYQSGVWAYHEWVQPHVDLAHVISHGEGNAPLVPAPRLAAALGLRHLWIKQCGQSPTGSFKDLGMTVLVSSVVQRIADGAPVRALACASTGDTSAALAAYGAAAGIPVLVLLPAGQVSAAQLLQPLAHGALVCSLDADFDGCMRVVQRLAADPTLYLANSQNSLRVEGQKTVAAELARDLAWDPPDWVLVPGGNLGNVAALAKGFLELRALGLVERIPRLVCCQAAAAAPLARAWERARAAGRSLVDADVLPLVAGPTEATAIRIGAPVSAPKAVRALRDTDGLAVAASEPEIAAAAARADRVGLYPCPHTAVALAGLERLRAAGTIAPADRVVVVATAHGLKFSEFKDRLVRGAGPHANRPLDLPGDPDAALAAIHRALDRGAGGAPRLSSTS